MSARKDVVFTMLFGESLFGFLEGEEFIRGWTIELNPKLDVGIHPPDELPVGRIRWRQLVRFSHAMDRHS